MATQFTLFAHLITELRLEIWRLALPPPIRKPLYPYKRGSWTYEDLGLEPDPNGEDLYMKLDTDQFEPLHIQLPLYSVNREARGVVIEYIHKHELLPTRCSAESDFEFHRCFDSRTGTMFLPTSDVEPFVMDLVDRATASDMIDRYMTTSNHVLPRLAITPSGLELLSRELLGAVNDTAGSIGTIYLVDVAHTGESTIREFEEPCRYTLLELGDVPRARLVWRSSRSGWEASGDDKAVVQLETLVKDLHDPANTTWRYILEIQLVSLTSSGVASLSASRNARAS